LGRSSVGEDVGCADIGREHRGGRRGCAGCRLCCPDSFGEGGSFGGRLRVEVPLEASDEILVRAKCTGAIAEPVVQQHEPPPAHFLIWIELARAPGELDRALGLIRRGGYVGS
jgi:hypothetical protein